MNAMHICLKSMSQNERDRCQIGSFFYITIHFAPNDSFFFLLVQDRKLIHIDYMKIKLGCRDAAFYVFNKFAL